MTDTKQIVQQFEENFHTIDTLIIEACLDAGVECDMGNALISMKESFDALVSLAMDAVIQAEKARGL